MHDNEIYCCKGRKSAHKELRCRGLWTHVRARRLTDRQIKVDKKTSPPMPKPPAPNKQRSDKTRCYDSTLVILTLSLIECDVTLKLELRPNYNFSSRNNDNNTQWNNTRYVRVKPILTRTYLSWGERVSGVSSQVWRKFSMERAARGDGGPPALRPRSPPHNYRVQTHAHIRDLTSIKH